MGENLFLKITRLYDIIAELQISKKRKSQMKIRRQFFRLIFLALFFLLNFSSVPAQQGSGSGIGTGGVMSQPYEKEDDITGSVVRGRVFYQDTSRPVRRGWIGFHKVRELVEPNSSDKTEKIVAVSRNWGEEKYVLTNDEGDFVMKGVKSGIYQPIVKVQGVLNPGYNDGENPNFQQITIDGASEIQMNIGVQRGGAISGRVLYSDGQPVIGARMQILIKKDTKYTNFSGDRNSFGYSITDDRGFYRFTALPVDEYVVFATEQSVQNASGVGTNNNNVSPFNNDSELKTFYPNAAEIKDARPISIFPGQEQADTNLTVPDRRLFKISGTVVAKSNNLPLKNMRVSFQKISDGAMMNFGFSDNQTKQTTTDSQGSWTLIDLPAGKYRVTAASNDVNTDYGNQPKAEDNQPKYAPFSKEVEIESDNLANVLFALSTQATISGTISVENDKPLPDYVFLRAFDEEKKINSSAYLNNRNDTTNQPQKPNNEFHIKGLSAGKFYVTASSNGGKYFVKSISSGGKDIKNAPLEIEDGENIEGVKIVLSSDVGTVKGKINNFKNEGFAGVVLIPTGKSPMLAISSIGGEAIVKPNGEFEVNAAPGEYFAVVGTEANRPKSENDFAEWFTNMTKDAPKVTVKAGETTGIDLDYPK